MRPAGVRYWFGAPARIPGSVSLAAGAFANVRVAAFIDSNPKYRGRTLHGVPILGPTDLGQRPEPILISTRGFQREIGEQIRGQLKLENRVICLYGDGSQTAPKG